MSPVTLEGIGVGIYDTVIFWSAPIQYIEEKGGLTKHVYHPGGYFGIFIHTNPFFGFKILNFNIFGVFFRKMNIFWGMKILWIFYGGHHKIGLYLGVISVCILGYFFKVKVQNGGIFGVAKNFKYFFGVLEIPDIFGG